MLSFICFVITTVYFFNTHEVVTPKFSEVFVGMLLIFAADIWIFRCKNISYCYNQLKRQPVTQLRWISIVLYSIVSTAFAYTILTNISIRLDLFTSEFIGISLTICYGALVAGLLLKLNILSLERSLLAQSELAYPSLFWSILVSSFLLLILLYITSDDLVNVCKFATCLVFGFASNWHLQKTQLSLSKPVTSDSGNSTSDTQTDHQNSFEEWLKKEQPLMSDDSKYAKEMGFDYTGYLNELKNLVEHKANIAIVGHYGSGKTSLANLALEQAKIQTEEGVSKIIRVPITTWGHAPNSINEFILSEILKELAQHIDVFRFQGLPQHYASSLQASKPGMLRVLGKFFEPNSEDPKEQLGALNQILQRQKLIVYLVIDDIERNPNLETLLPQVASLLDEIKQSYDYIRFIINLTTNFTELPSQFLRKADSTQAVNTNSLPSIPPSAVLTLDNINALNRVYTSKVVINLVNPEHSWDYIKEYLKKKLETLFNLQDSTDDALPLKRAIIDEQLKSNLLVNLKLDDDAKNPRYVKYLIRSFWFSLTKEVAHNTKAATTIPLSSLLKIALYKQGAGADADRKKIQQDEYYTLFTAQAEPNNYYDVGQFIDAVYGYPTQPKKLDSISLLQCRNCLSYMNEYPVRFTESFQSLDEFLTKLLQATTPFESLNDDVLHFLVKITETFFFHFSDKKQPVTSAKYLNRLCLQINEWIESNIFEEQLFILNLLIGMSNLGQQNHLDSCRYILKSINSTLLNTNYSSKLAELLQRLEQHKTDEQIEQFTNKINTLIEKLTKNEGTERAILTTEFIYKTIEHYFNNDSNGWLQLIESQLYTRGENQSLYRQRGYLSNLVDGIRSEQDSRVIRLYNIIYPLISKRGKLIEPLFVRAFINSFDKNDHAPLLRSLMDIIASQKNIKSQPWETNQLRLITDRSDEQLTPYKIDDENIPKLRLDFLEKLKQIESPNKIQIQFILSFLVATACQPQYPLKILNCNDTKPLAQKIIKAIHAQLQQNPINNETNNIIRWLERLDDRDKNDAVLSE